MFLCLHSNHTGQQRYLEVISFGIIEYLTIIHIIPIIHEIYSSTCYMTIIPIRADEIGLASLAWWTSTTQCLANNLLTVLYCASKYLIWWDHKIITDFYFLPAKKYKAGQSSENYTWTDSSSRNNIWSSFSSTDLNVNIDKRQ